MNATTSLHPRCNDQSVWNQVYRYSLRQCFDRHADAEDLTQDVFHRLLENGAMSRYQESVESESKLVNLLRVTARRLFITNYHRGQSSRAEVENA